MSVLEGETGERVNGPSSRKWVCCTSLRDCSHVTSATRAERHEAAPASAPS